MAMQADYDFPVELQAITTQSSNLPIPNRYAVVRTDTLKTIGIVSRKYALLPHAEVVGTLRDAFQGEEVDERIVLTHGGARMYLELTLPNVTIKVRGDDIAMRLTVANSYDGSRKVQLTFGAYRLVCSNGMIIGRRLIAVARRHVGDVHLEAAQMRTQMTSLTLQFKATAPRLRQMATTKLSAPKPFFNAKTLQLPAYLATIARKKFHEELENEETTGTVWDAYNALTFAITHKMRHGNPELAARLGKNAWSAAIAHLGRG